MVSCFSHVQFFVTLWTVARQASVSMEFSCHEHWSGLSFLTLGELPNSRIEPAPPRLIAKAWVIRTETGWRTGWSQPELPTLKSGEASQMVLVVKNPPANAEDRRDVGLIPGLARSDSSILAWEIPWMEELGRLQFMGSRRVGHDWSESMQAESGVLGKQLLL